MPALRLATRRRRSSHAIFTPAKPGIYGIPQPRPVPVTFAPNVTPITFTAADPDDTADPSNPLSSYALAAALGNPSASGLLTSKLFPPSETPAPPPTRKRCPPGKRRSQGYIPRPPNAFMLFRADFVRQKHVPGSIETNHGSLSKIIGTCWRQLPLEDKRVWEVKAKQEKAAHKAMFPDYRFRPVHNKNKHVAASSSNSASSSSNAHTSSSPTSGGADDASKRREKQPTTLEDERRCDEVAALLLEGKKGEELARAVRNLDRARSMQREQEEREREQDERDMMEEYELELEAADEQPQPQDNATLHMPAPAFINPFASSPFASNTHLYAPSFNTSATNHSMYHRRSSSVPLPNEWQPHGHNFSQFNQFGHGIAIPTVPQFSLSRPESPVGSIARFNQTQFTDPFQSTSASTTTGTDYTFAPIPEFTPADTSFPSSSTTSQLFHPVPHHAHSHSLQNAIPPSQHDFTQTQTLQHPVPLSSQLMPFMTQTTPRSSLGLGQRRASSAQGVLMRAWTMPMSFTSTEQGGYDTASMGMNTQSGFGYAGMDMPLGMNMGDIGAYTMGNGIVARDPSPLPDVESGLFADFSFGESLQSQNTISADTDSQADTHSQSHSQSTSPPLSRSHTHALSLGLGLDIAIPPTASLSRLDTSTSGSYSPAQLPPPSAVSGSSSTEASPLSAAGGLPETPATGMAPSNTGSGDSVMSGGAARLPSLDISAYMDMDRLYAAEAGFDAAQQYEHHAQHQSHQQQGYAGYFGYEVDPVEKRAEAYGSAEGYYEASA